MILVLLLALIDGRPAEPCYSVDVIELNHVYDCADGCHKFTQVIVWNWKPEVRRHHVDAWWIVDTKQLSQMPSRTNCGWKVRRNDGVVVFAKVYQETHSGYDREVADRAVWNESLRFLIGKAR
jgi:hypothetical protein